MKRVCALVLMAMGVLGCNDGDDGDGAAAGFVLLEYDRGPTLDGAPLQFLSASLQFATTEEVDPDVRAATHGTYGSGGLIADGNCIAVGDLQSYDLEGIDVGESVTLESGGSSLEFARVGTGTDVVYNVVSDFAPYVDPSLAELGSDYSLAWSGTADIEAGEFTETLFLPNAISGPTVTQLQSGTITQVAANEDYEVQWEPLDGVDRVFVRFHDAAGAPVTVCMVPDTGSYTVSTELLAMQPANGNLAVGYIYETTDEIAGRQFQLLGSSCAFGQYAIE